jgi:hypothetical protein
MNKFALACVFLFGSVAFAQEATVAVTEEGVVVLEQNPHGCGCGGKNKGTGGGN